MRLRKLSTFSVAICLLFCGCGGARTASSVGGGGASSDKDGLHSTHRQYSHSLDTGSSVSYGGSKPIVASLASASAGSSTYGSGEASSGARNSGVYDSSKSFTNQQSSVEYGGAAEGTGNFHSLVRKKYLRVDAMQFSVFLDKSLNVLVAS